MEHSSPFPITSHQEPFFSRNHFCSSSTLPNTPTYKIPASPVHCHGTSSFSPVFSALPRVIHTDPIPSPRAKPSAEESKVLHRPSNAKPRILEKPTCFPKSGRWWDGWNFRIQRKGFLIEFYRLILLMLMTLDFRIQQQVVCGLISINNMSCLLLLEKRRWLSKQNEGS